MWMHFIDVNQVYDNINENLGYVSVEPKYVCVYENVWFFFLRFEMQVHITENCDMYMHLRYVC